MNTQPPPGPRKQPTATPRKIVERALFLPLIGLLLFIPPIAGIFDINVTVAGIPFTVIYLFVVWGLLIFSAFRLSRTLAHLEENEIAGMENQTAEQENRQ